MPYSVARLTLLEGRPSSGSGQLSSPTTRTFVRFVTSGLGEGGLIAYGPRLILIYRLQLDQQQKLEWLDGVISRHDYPHKRYWTSPTAVRS
jgi:hypothetical protein